MNQGAIGFPSAGLAASSNDVHVGTAGVSITVATGSKLRLFGSAADSGLAAPGTVADATDAASVILRLNELLAIQRSLGVLTA